MFVLKFILATVLVVASARHLPQDNEYQRSYQEALTPHLYLFDEEGHPVYKIEEVAQDEEEPNYTGKSRIRRASTSVTLNSDGGIGLVGKVPLTSNENNRLSAIGTMDLTSDLNTGAKGLGLQLENANGHSLTVLKQNVPGREDSLTAAGKLNVFHNDNHNVDVRGSITRHMPEFSYVPDHNTVGGGVDYMYKDKIGGSLGMSSTPYFDRKDYSAMGNLNLYKDRTSSFDFNGGFRKIETPHFSTGWEPGFGLTWSKSW